MSEDTRQMAQQPQARCGLRRRFHRACDGAVAVEFAIVALPFFMLLFAIIEAGLLFFVNQTLDNALNDSARQIRTGQTNTGTQTAFKNSVCAGMVGLGDCANKLYVDVRVMSSFSSYTYIPPVDASGNMRTMVYQTSNAGDIVVARAYLQWPVLFDLVNLGGPRLNNGDRVLSSVVAFRNEPF